MSTHEVQEKCYYNDPKNAVRPVSANSVDTEQSDQGRHCFPCLHLSTALLHVKHTLFYFRVITANCLRLPIFQILHYSIQIKE